MIEGAEYLRSGLLDPARSLEKAFDTTPDGTRILCLDDTIALIILF